MSSKEEIEKSLNNLWNSLDDELFSLTYSQEEMQKDLRTVLNEYNYLDIMNDRKKQKIQHLESREQKLIEKLECAIDFGKTGTDVVTKIKIECLENVLKILKGENDE